MCYALYRCELIKLNWGLVVSCGLGTQDFYIHFPLEAAVRHYFMHIVYRISCITSNPERFGR